MKKLFLYLAFYYCLFNTINSHAQTWYAIGGAGFSPDTVYNTGIALDGSGTPYVVYLDVSQAMSIEHGPDNYFTVYPATVMEYNGSNWIMVGSAGFTVDGATNPAIAINIDGAPYIAYSSAYNGKAEVMEYYGGWGYSTYLSSSRGYYTSIAIDGSGAPYVVYDDWSNNGKATVMEYNGIGWIAIGGPGFSAGYEQFNTIAIDKSNTPYVAFQDFSAAIDTGGRATVMKYTSGSWELVGNAGFSAGLAQYTSIAIDTDGTPYVVYQDTINGWKATVMKFNGSSWIAVGSPGFSLGKAQYTTIAIDKNGTPYVAYQDMTTYKAVVMKYNGSNWVAVGSTGLSVGAYTSIAIDTAGTPYLAYQDGDNGWKATVMKFGMPTAINNIVSANTLTIFPNPITTSLTIQSTNSPITQIIITNVLGQTLYLQSAPANCNLLQVDVSTFPTGIYFLKVNGTEVKKFVKE